MTNQLLAELEALQLKNEQFKEAIKRRDEFIKYQQEKIDKAIEYINKHKIEWVDKKFKNHNVMVKFNEYTNPQALLEILGDKDK